MVIVRPSTPGRSFHGTVISSSSWRDLFQILQGNIQVIDLAPAETDGDADFISMLLATPAHAWS